jgi:CheY-like chemotaxis protein
MRPRIFVIEDDESSRRLLTLVLESRGYEVLSAAEPGLCPIYTDPNARCTHEFACGDFLLTDNRMPRMTGLEFVARQSERGCKGVVHNKAVFSGTWNAEEKETALRLGCKTFTKPYDTGAIFHWLQEREKTLPPDRKLAALSEL